MQMRRAGRPRSLLLTPHFISRAEQSRAVARPSPATDTDTSKNGKDGISPFFDVRAKTVRNTSKSLKFSVKGSQN